MGDPTCYFCSQEESISLLFFQCSTAKAVWAIVAKCIGADNVPRSIGQCWLWCEKWLSHGKQFHTIGIAVICWAIWKTRNKACFKGKLLKNPASIICYACALMGYWTGLFGELEHMIETLVAGANTMLQIATKLLGKKMKKEERLLLRTRMATNRTEANDVVHQTMHVLLLEVILLVYQWLTRC